MRSKDTRWRTEAAITISLTEHRFEDGDLIEADEPIVVREYVSNLTRLRRLGDDHLVTEAVRALTDLKGRVDGLHAQGRVQPQMTAKRLVAMRGSVEGIARAFLDVLAAEYALALRAWRDTPESVFWGAPLGPIDDVDDDGDVDECDDDDE